MMFSVIRAFVLCLLLLSFRPDGAYSQSTTGEKALVCIAGRCIESSSSSLVNITLGAHLIFTNRQTQLDLHLLPSSYSTIPSHPILSTLVSSTPQLLLAPSSLSSSPNLAPLRLSSSSTLGSTFPLDLTPPIEGLTTFPSALYAGQGNFSPLPTSANATTGNVIGVQGARSVALGTQTMVVLQGVSGSVGSGVGGKAITIWESIPDIDQLPSSLNINLNANVQSTTCTEKGSPCSSGGTCLADGTCACSEGFQGVMCELSTSSPSTNSTLGITGGAEKCGCTNGVCTSDNASCLCSTGWSDAPGPNGKCSVCSPGFFRDATGECTICNPGCSACVDQTGSCTICREGFTQDSLDPTKCRETPNVTNTGTLCPDGAYPSPLGEGRCEPCSAACKTCVGPESSDCLTCARGSFEFNGACVGASGEGVCLVPSNSGETSLGLIADNFKQRCTGCGSKCTACQLPGFTIGSLISSRICTGCISGYILDTSSGQCVESCPTGFAPSPSASSVNGVVTLVCTPCQAGDGCLSCSSSGSGGDQCLVCDASRSLFANPSTGKCVPATQCPAGTYANEQSGTCDKCHGDCASCTGPGFDKCLSCPPARPALQKGRCVESCGRGEYAREDGSCARCDAGCGTCMGPGQTECLSCTGLGKLLRNGACVSVLSANSCTHVEELGICLEELVGNKESLQLSPSPSSSKAKLEWWHYLLMALGVLFLVLLVFIIWRRRAKKKRVDETKAWAEKKGVGFGRGRWGWFGWLLSPSKKEGKRGRERSSLPISIMHSKEDGVELSGMGLGRRESLRFRASDRPYDSESFNAKSQRVVSSPSSYHDTFAHRDTSHRERDRQSARFSLAPPPASALNAKIVTMGSGTNRRTRLGLQEAKAERKYIPSRSNTEDSFSSFSSSSSSEDDRRSLEDRDRPMERRRAVEEPSLFPALVSGRGTGSRPSGRENTVRFNRDRDSGDSYSHSYSFGDGGAGRGLKKGYATGSKGGYGYDNGAESHLTGVPPPSYIDATKGRPSSTYPEEKKAERMPVDLLGLGNPIGMTTTTMPAPRIGQTTGSRMDTVDSMFGSYWTSNPEMPEVKKDMTGASGISYSSKNPFRR